MPKKSKPGRARHVPLKAAELLAKLRELCGAGPASLAERRAQLEALHADCGGHNFQKLLKLGWGTAARSMAGHEEDTETAALGRRLDEVVAACFAASGKPMEWRFPFTNFVVIAVKTVPQELAPKSPTVAWLARNYARLPLNTKALLFETNLLSGAAITALPAAAGVDAEGSRGGGGGDGGAMAGAEQTPPLPGGGGDGGGGGGGGGAGAANADSSTITLPYLREMGVLITEARARGNFRAAFSVLASALARCPIGQLPVDAIRQLLLDAIHREQASHTGVLGEQRLQAAIRDQPQLVEFVRGLQRDAVDAMVEQRDAKGAMKLFRQFHLTETECPALRGLCERNALSWPVSAGHYDMLEGRLSRRPELLPLVQELWLAKHKTTLADFLASRTGGDPADIGASPAHTLAALRDVVQLEFAAMAAEQAAVPSEVAYRTRVASVDMVATAAELRAMVHHILTGGGRLFAFDCEWTPSLSAFDRQYCAILTIATRTRAFLVDCVALRPVADAKTTGGEESVTETLDRLFCDPTVTNIGYATHGDMSTLRVTFPSSRGFMAGGNHVDVSKSSCVRALVTPRFIEVHQPAPRSLSALVEVVLDCKLPKVSQMSDWERRPLRPEQIKYAVDDADCLLALWYEGGLRELVEARTAGKPAECAASSAAAAAAAGPASASPAT